MATKRIINFSTPFYMFALIIMHYFAVIIFTGDGRLYWDSTYQTTADLRGRSRLSHPTGTYVKTWGDSLAQQKFSNLSIGSLSIIVEFSISAPLSTKSGIHLLLPSARHPRHFRSPNSNTVCFPSCQMPFNVFSCPPLLLSHRSLGDTLLLFPATTICIIYRGVDRGKCMWKQWDGSVCDPTFSSWGLEGDVSPQRGPGQNPGGKRILATIY